MAAEVFRPQNCFVDRVGVPPAACPRRRYGGYTQDRPYNCNSKFNRRPVRSEQRKRVGSNQVDHRPFSSRSRSADDLKSARNTEKVTIMRRGQSLDWTKQEKKEARVMAAGPCVVDLRSDTYAGSAFAVSPSPSSLPLPSFSKKKQILVDDSASRDLRRLLRLEI